MDCEKLKFNVLSLFFLVLSLCAASCLASCEEAKTATALTVSYDSTADQVIIDNGWITHTQIKYEFKNPISSIVTGKKLLVGRGELAPEECQHLWEQIEASGFMQLERNRYGAPERLRHYLSSLKVVRGKSSKFVLYAQNPSFEKAPEAFDKVSNYVLGLAKSHVTHYVEGAPPPGQ